MAHDRLCDAAQQQALETRSTMGANDDQISLPVSCLIHNHRARIAIAHGGLCGQTTRAERLGRTGGPLFGKVP